MEQLQATQHHKVSDWYYTKWCHNFCVSSICCYSFFRINIQATRKRQYICYDQLQSIGVPLNIPPFLDGKEQLTTSEVQQGRSIALIRIHVERAIGRLKNFTILKGVFSLKMAHLVNQIIFVCAMLTNSLLLSLSP